MTNAFADAKDAIFGDDNIAVDATWLSGGAGAGTPIRIILSEPDELLRSGGMQIVYGSHTFRVRVSDVTEPVEGDTAQIGVNVYRVIGAPRVDARNLVWTCEAEFNAP